MVENPVRTEPNKKIVHISKGEVAAAAGAPLLSGVGLLLPGLWGILPTAVGISIGLTGAILTFGREYREKHGIEFIVDASENALDK